MPRKYIRKQTDWLTPNQASKYLGLSRPTIMRYINNGQLKANNVSITKFRPYWRIHKDWADSFLRDIKPDNII